jgi:DNA repair photolyase
MSLSKPLPLWAVASAEYEEAAAAELWTGCDFGCRYCLPIARRMARRFKLSRGEAIAQSTVEPRTCDPLNLRVLNGHSAAFRGLLPPVLLSLTCDPYPVREETDHLTRRAISTMHRYGVGVRVLTKSGTRAVADFQPRRGTPLPLQREHPEVSSLDDVDPNAPANLGSHPDDAYGISLVALDAGRMASEEPRAAPPEERIAGIEEAHSRSVRTWVNVMPVVDAGEGVEVVRRTIHVADFFTVGLLRPMEAPRPHAPWWSEFSDRLRDLCTRHGKPCFVYVDDEVHADATGRSLASFEREHVALTEAVMDRRHWRQGCLKLGPRWERIPLARLARSLEECQQGTRRE